MNFFQNYNLKDFNSYAINAICAKAWFPNSTSELISIYKDYPDNSFIIIGNGNNIILSKEFYQEDFIILNGCFNRIEVTNHNLYAEAGATLKTLSEIALQNSLTGLEIFYDIPSSVGGAIVMNAGTKDGEIKDILTKVCFLDLTDMEIKQLSREEIGYDYRSSFFQKHKDKIVLGGWFRLDRGQQNDIESKMKKYKELRWEKQPREFPNCGSVFKRPPGYYVGELIDKLGIKGFRIGDAQVSEKHGGFIINVGNAKGADIVKLIEHIQYLVREKFNVELAVEQKII